ncbi:MAG: pyrimidine dimer DNA glycosylase [Elusimicrobia bacterium RIFOXYA12_FULL_51_18]|nr:MAG: pyrimidine dimer DNA glycosylase [Elusimicrobia bacterium RIFOXYA12_FULL_51_18]OGS30310.1 MAG: pyrimidine dimer DNA glycosylase [Elusimicrobia bacterium RIFOXYA2_FULL_53_38]
MRIWDIKPQRLCRNHLLGEHRELHCIWVVLTQGKKGYSRHPETLRWRGCLKALYSRHAEQVSEMERRGYCHKSPLNRRMATGRAIQDKYIDTPRKQLKLLAAKKCECKVLRSRP